MCYKYGVPATEPPQADAVRRFHLRWRLHGARQSCAHMVLLQTRSRFVGSISQAVLYWLCTSADRACLMSCIAPCVASCITSCVAPCYRHLWTWGVDWERWPRGLDVAQAVVVACLRLVRTLRMPMEPRRLQRLLQQPCQRRGWLQSKYGAVGWDYDAIIAKLKAGEYAAFISGDTQLIPRAYEDDSCMLHALPEPVEDFDTAIAFSRTFPSPELRSNISALILQMQDNGMLTVRLQSSTDVGRHRCAIMRQNQVHLALTGHSLNLLPRLRQRAPKHSGDCTLGGLARKVVVAGSHRYS